ncbi:transcriptional regulator [Sphaerisporangium melleum]|uniref:Transcriptional regulator n=1 Tax=Sphaerisporangium melleum TaxID=321316 RepID=A0A917VKA3_9ACTN|nr:helix-turn-helix transcriptional regulator [Sphaerisporangium melleum]GGK90170.1 transcriptional regulator [Sphaerisporangium melleum]GII72592.1 transcriptional regulator [Sphaerisporangium melleum]
MERTPPHPDVSEFDLQRVLEALVDPVRRSIVAQLGSAGADIACGGFDIPVGKSTATHHFKVLREAGLIRQYYRGTSRMNALRRAEVDQAFPGLLDALTGPHTAGSPHPEPTVRHAPPAGRPAAR